MCCHESHFNFSVNQRFQTLDWSFCTHWSSAHTQGCHYLVLCEDEIPSRGNFSEYPSHRVRLGEIAHSSWRESQIRSKGTYKLMLFKISHIQRAPFLSQVCKLDAITRNCFEKGRKKKSQDCLVE